MTTYQQQKKYNLTDPEYIQSLTDDEIEKLGEMLKTDLKMMRNILNGKANFTGLDSLLRTDHD